MILGITIFALQNGQPLEVEFLTWGFESSLIAVILGAALLGAAIVSLFAFPVIIKKHFRERRLAKQVQELEHLLEKKEIVAPPTSPPPEI